LLVISTDTATRKREAAYAKMTSIEVTAEVMRMLNEGKAQQALRYLACLLRGVNPNHEAVIAWREYLRRGGDLDYFTVGAGATGSCTII
jgi:hypothetical protein